MDNTREIPSAAAGVDEVLQGVFTGLGELRELAVEMQAAAAAAGHRPTTSDLATLRPTVLAHLADSSYGPGATELAGTGVIAAPDALADQPRWLEWWRTDHHTAEPRPLTVDLDPHHVQGYDYTNAAWFSWPRRTGRRTVVGPYVDFAGTDEYILTFAEPIQVSSGFFGVAAADIRASDFEQAMLPALDAAGARALLVNASGRVVASNTPEVIIGSLAPPGERTEHQLPDSASWSGCGGLPWSLRLV